MQQKMEVSIILATYLHCIDAYVSSLKKEEPLKKATHIAVQYLLTFLLLFSPY